MNPLLVKILVLGTFVEDWSFFYTFLKLMNICLTINHVTLLNVLRLKLFRFHFDVFTIECRTRRRINDKYSRNEKKKLFFTQQKLDLRRTLCRTSVP